MDCSSSFFQQGQRNKYGGQNYYKFSKQIKENVIMIFRDSILPH